MGVVIAAETKQIANEALNSFMSMGVSPHVLDARTRSRTLRRPRGPSAAPPRTTFPCFPGRIDAIRFGTSRRAFTRQTDS